MLRWGATAAANTIQVENAAPETSFTVEATDDGATLRFSAPTDASAADVAAGWRYAVACDNGALAAVTYTSSSPGPTASCQLPPAGGSHTIRGRIIDKDGGFSEDSATVKIPARVQVYLPVVWFSGTDAPWPMQQLNSTGSEDRGR